MINLGLYYTSSSAIEQTHKKLMILPFAIDANNLNCAKKNKDLFDLNYQYYIRTSVV